MWKGDTPVDLTDNSTPRAIPVSECQFKSDISISRISALILKTTEQIAERVCKLMNRKKIDEFLEIRDLLINHIKGPLLNRLWNGSVDFHFPASRTSNEIRITLTEENFVKILRGIFADRAGRKFGLHTDIVSDILNNEA